MKDYVHLPEMGRLAAALVRDVLQAVVEVDDERITYHRLEYDVRAVQEKILATRGLDARLAARLAEGI